MILSIVKLGFFKVFTPSLLVMTVILLYFKSAEPLTTNIALSQCNRFLNQSYDASADAKLKKWEMMVTPDRFIRFRKTFQNGKQEYYSFRIQHFIDMDCLGTVSAGLLLLKTNADDIIVQTHNDPKGDEDNMVSTMSIPVKNVEPERLDSLRAALVFLRDSQN